MAILSRVCLSSRGAVSDCNVEFAYVRMVSRRGESSKAFEWFLCGICDDRTVRVKRMIPVGAPALSTAEMRRYVDLRDLFHPAPRSLPLTERQVVAVPAAMALRIGLKVDRFIARPR